MTRRVNARGDGLEAAVRDALSQLAGADPEEVHVDLSAPGLEALGTVQVTLEVDEGASRRSGAGEDDEPAPATDEEPQPEEASGADEEGEDRDGDEDDDGDDGDDGDEETAGVSIDELDQEAEAGADFLEGILDALDLPGDIQIRVHEDRAEIEVVNVGSGRLIGRRGQTLDAIQELARCALQRRFERRSRVVIDVEGYRARRLEKLLDKARDAIEDVRDSGQPERLEPMDVFERKAVHRLVAEHEGVTSSSRGREPTRRVIIEPE